MSSSISPNIPSIPSATPNSPGVLHLKRRMFYVVGISLVSFVTKKTAHFIKDNLSAIFHIYHKQFQTIKCTKTIPSSQKAWALNAARLREAHANAKTEKAKRQIQFLATNYLCKTAPVHSYIFRPFFSKLKTIETQVGGFEDYSYHRFALHQKVDMGERFNKELAMSSTSPLILTDTVQFEHLLPLKFHVLEDQMGDKMADVLLKHLQKSSFGKSLEQPFLIDLTDSLSDSIKDKKGFEKKFRSFQKELNQAIEEAATAVVANNPKLKKKAVKKFIKQNTTGICRCELDKISGVKMLPLFSKLTSKNILKKNAVFFDFFDKTGLLLGAIPMRKHVLNVFQQRRDIKLIVKPTHLPPIYESKESFITDKSFAKCSKLFRTDVLAQKKPHLAVLGKATVDVVEGLINEISADEWKALSTNEDTGQIFQHALKQVQLHLENATESLHDFTVFAQEIELAQAELATVLELSKPFKRSDFDPIYKSVVKKTVPKELRDNITTGLGKTSVNIFAGINAAVMNQNPNAVRVFSEGFYFEQALLLGDNTSTFDSVKTSPSAKVDLYVGQFNPNIEIDSNFKKYKRRDIASDVQYLLDNDKAAEHLTVAIDCTIDTLDSQNNVKALLAKFQKEIQEGRLNFVFFHSGQKFDMLGMDNYYGSPFYLVNNGAPQWQSFASLKTEKVHKTDMLSLQWFCLSNKYAKDSLRNYRQLIFDNTRTILDNIPPELFSKQNAKIRVSKASKKMDACFIDIKLLKPLHEVKGYLLMAKFYQKMLEHNVKAYTRGSFGYFHPNCIFIWINAVKDSATMRINPGINPEDNEAMIQYFKELSSLI